MDPSGKTVAIVGAGPSGLVAAKNILTARLQPTIFDKSSEIGGMWNPTCHPSWKSLKTNLSCFTTCYSDFPWPDDSSVFPTQTEMADYLKNYSAQFIPQHCFQLQARVTTIKPAKSEGIKTWMVEWTNAIGRHVDFFDYVIIATGFFSTSYIPNIPLETFTGTIIHSEQYRSPGEFRNKRIVVVGSSFSAAEICAEVCRCAREVINVVSTPFWAIPRFIPLRPQDPATPFLPVDMVFYIRTGRKLFQEIVTKSAEDYRTSHQYFSKLSGREIGPSEMHDFQPEENSSSPTFVAISDEYLPNVRSGRITTRIGRVKSACGSTVTLEDGSTVEDVDTIIVCTGFRPNFPFFLPEILEAISFDPTDSFCPLLLHKATFCASLPGLAFVGVYRGPYFLIAELQSKWIATVFSRNETIPSFELKKGTLVEKQIRDQRPRPQFPHPDYVGFSYDLATEVGILPSNDFTEYRPLFVPADFCPENMASFERMNAEREMFLAGKMVAGAVFRALPGHWTVSEETPSTQQTKMAFLFDDREGEEGADTIQYLRSVCKSDGDKSDKKSSFVHGWSYDHLKDELSITFSFAHKNASGYHALYFLPPSSEWKNPPPKQIPDIPGWRAVSEFVDGHETYKLYFLFQFAGVLLKNVQIAVEIEDGQNMCASLTVLGHDTSTKKTKL